jgi:hypothetical protein
MIAALAAEDVLAADETPGECAGQDPVPGPGRGRGEGPGKKDGKTAAAGAPHALITRTPDGRLTFLQALASRRKGSAGGGIPAAFTGYLITDGYTGYQHLLSRLGPGGAQNWAGDTRTLQVLPAPDGLFPHAAQAFLIERAVRDPHDGRLRSAVAALGITSRTLQRGGTPEVIAAAARGHRDIEALHHVRDTTMNEDAQRLRAGSSAQVIAAVRNTAVAALRLAGFTSTVPGRR